MSSHSAGSSAKQCTLHLLRQKKAEKGRLGVGKGEGIGGEHGLEQRLRE